jgi:methyl-accepting chemotaxis protein
MICAHGKYQVRETMRIRAALIVFGIILATALLGLVIAFSWAISEIRVGGTLYHEIIRSKDLVSDAVPPVVNLMESYVLIQQCLDDTNPNSRKERLDKITNLKAAYEQRIAYWENAMPDGQMRTLLCDTSRVPADQFFAAVSATFIPASLANDRITMKKLATGDLRSFYTTHEQAILKLVELADADQRLHEESAAGRIRTVIIMTLAMGLGLGLVCGLMLVLTIRRITAGLGRAVTALDTLASGDLTQRMPESGKDEFAKLAKSLNHLAQEETRLVGLVRQQAGVLTEQGNGLTHASTSIVEVANDTRQRASEASDAAGRLAHGASAVAQASAGLEAAAREIATSLEGSSETVSKAATLARGADTTIQTLGKASEEISTVAAEIAAIAGQTNLLALNATIEAASAGEAGRGFAVVAQEVKNLARKTAEATAVVGKRLDAIQKATHQAVIQVREVAAAVEHLEQQHHSIAAAVEEQSHATASMSADLQSVAAEGRTITGAMQAATAAATRASGAADHVLRSAEELRHSAKNLVATVADRTI